MGIPRPFKLNKMGIPQSYKLSEMGIPWPYNLSEMGIPKLNNWVVWEFPSMIFDRDGNSPAL
jgi:hypothetical protein